MTTTRFTDHMLSGDHASRPAASAVPQGALYSCTTHSKIYKSDGTSTWSDWAIPGSTETLPATIIDAKGDLIAGTAADTAARVAVGSNDTILMADSGQTAGIKWVASQTPSTQAFSDSATEGTADTYARGDHKHGMPADPGGGGGGGAIDCKGWVAQTYSSTNALAITIAAQAAGTRILVAVGTRNNDVTSLSCTNVTWTEVKGWASGTSTYLSIYVGVVAGGSSGTTITVNVGGTNYVFATAVFLGDALTPTTGADASYTGTVATGRRLPLTIATTPGDLFAMAYTTSDASSPISQMETSSPSLWVPDQLQDGLCGLHLRVGMAGGDHVSGWYDGGNGTTVVVGLVGIS